MTQHNRRRQRRVRAAHTRSTASAPLTDDAVAGQADERAPLSLTPDHGAAEGQAAASQAREHPVITAAALPLPAGMEAAAPAAEAGAGHHRMVTSAAIIMVGNLLSSVLGMVRIETVNALFYGATSGDFTTALRPVQQISDLLVGGSVSGALIPTFVDYSGPEQRDELRHVYCSVANLVALVMSIALVGLAVAAPFFIPLETGGYSPHHRQLTVQLVQIAALSLLGLGLYLVGSALLYALKVVVYPAFATGIYHVGVITCGTLVLLYALHQAGLPLGAALRPGSANPTIALAREAGARGLAAGAALGAAGEFLLLLPALRRVFRYWQPVLDLRHPAVRQILRLYAPIALGLVVSVAAQNLDVTLLNLTPGGSPQNITSYWSAVTLIQFPVGLVAAALSFSVLPPLAAAATAGDGVGFKRTLVLGFRLGLLLMIPAMVGLLVLRIPIMALLFQHGACDAGCTHRNVLALQNMSYQLPFIALDQLLIAAYYARKNTLVPTLVGLASIVCYAAVAVPFYRTIGLPAMAFANAVQNSSHAVILFILLTLAIGGLGLRALASGLARIGLAAAGMAAVCWSLLTVLPRLSASLFSLHHLAGQVLTVLLVGGAGAGVYFLLAAWLRVEEVHLLRNMLRSRLRGSR
jgi:putative peptidoglycan lipid II flippase